MPASPQNVSANLIYERRSLAASRRMCCTYWSLRPGRGATRAFLRWTQLSLIRFFPGAASPRPPLACLLENASGPTEYVPLGRMEDAFFNAANSNLGNMIESMSRPSLLHQVWRIVLVRLAFRGDVSAFVVGCDESSRSRRSSSTSMRTI